ncbi:ROK family protein [Streptococcus catagoni]|uniref:ROK family protein n=1 Tax=Streptococcus catagoni TaxID=2654874 RepID=UPI00140AF473|nr:ROK family protein [Streptococcus catagoni]
MENYLTIDIGGTGIKYGIIDQSGQLTEKHEMTTEAYKGGSAILEKVKHLVSSYKEKLPLSGVAISSAGMVDPEKGEIFYAGPQIPHYAGTQFKKVIEEAYHLPCQIDNDVNCAGLAEAISGAAKDSPVTVCLTVGTGIGGCLLIDSKIFHGFSYAACEVGYMHLADGSFQDLASTTALVKEVAKKVGDPIEAWDGRRIFQAAKSGDLVCIEAIDRMVKYLAQGIANICYVTNPSLIVLGGGIMAEEAYLAEKIQKAVEDNLVPSLSEKLQIRFAHYKNDAGMVGAYYHFKEKEASKN